MGWGNWGSKHKKRAFTLNGRRVEVESDEPMGFGATGAAIRRAARLDEGRLLIDGETRQIVGPHDRPVGEALYDAPRFSKGA